MDERTVYFLSDQTGVTAETLGHSLLTQFNSQDFRQVTLPFIDSEDKARDAVRKINEAAGKSALRPIIFSTLVQDECRAIVREAKGLHLDIFDAFLEPLGEELHEQPTHATGRAHGMSDIDAYMKRIEATNFALANDDGGISRNYDAADVILVGVSRSGKTPTCLYLALQYGAALRGRGPEQPPPLGQPDFHHLRRQPWHRARTERLVLERTPFASSSRNLAISDRASPPASMASMSRAIRRWISCCSFAMTAACSCMSSHSLRRITRSTASGVRACSSMACNTVSLTASTCGCSATRGGRRIRRLLAGLALVPKLTGTHDRSIVGLDGGS